MRHTLSKLACFDVDQLTPLTSCQTNTILGVGLYYNAVFHKQVMLSDTLAQKTFIPLHNAQPH